MAIHARLRKEGQRHPGCNPYDPAWIEGDLRDLAQRALSGEPEKRIREELVFLLWPWANYTAERLVRRLPPGADPDNVRSEVMWELFLSVERIDWVRYKQWPALLKARLRGAFTATARSDDPLTRGQRRGRNTFLATEEQLMQRHGRSLTANERLRLAVALAPRGGIMSVLYGGKSVVPLDTMHESADEQASPEDQVISRERASAIRCWLAQDVPPDVSKAVEVWMEGTSSTLSASLRSSMAPFVKALLTRL
ncbi:hypothetical protein [Streptomyces sp. 900105245]